MASGRTGARTARSACTARRSSSQQRDQREACERHVEPSAQSAATRPIATADPTVKPQFVNRRILHVEDEAETPRASR